MTKITWKKGFAVFTDFQQTVKVFPTNFINLDKAKPQNFHYIMIKSNKAQNFSPV